MHFNRIFLLLGLFVAGITYANVSWIPGNGSYCPGSRATNMIYSASTFNALYFPGADKKIHLLFDLKDEPNEPIMDLTPGQMVTIPSAQFSAQYLGGKTTGNFQVLGLAPRNSRGMADPVYTVYARGKIDLLTGMVSCDLVNAPQGAICEIKTNCMYETFKSYKIYRGTRVWIIFSENA